MAAAAVAAAGLGDSEGVVALAAALIHRPLAAILERVATTGVAVASEAVAVSKATEAGRAQGLPLILTATVVQLVAAMEAAAARRSTLTWAILELCRCCHRPQRCPPLLDLAA